MTTRELLEKAKAVGGWFVNDRGKIRTYNAKDCHGIYACPIIAVLSNDGLYSNGSAIICAMARGLRQKGASDITLSADYALGKYRKQMEGWCK